MYLFSLYLHVITATLWIGGQLFIPLVLIPSVKSTIKDEGVKKNYLYKQELCFL